MLHDFGYLSRPEYDAAALELELQAVERHSIEVLGNRLQFSDQQMLLTTESPAFHLIAYSNHRQVSSSKASIWVLDVHILSKVGPCFWKGCTQRNVTN